MAFMRPNKYRLARKLHKWFGLILGVQVFFWIAGGVIMSIIPLEKVHGDHLASKTLANTLVAQDYSYNVATVLQKVDEKVISIYFSQVLQQPVYIIKTVYQTLRYDAVSGQKMAPLEQPQAEQLAKLHYLSDGKLSAVEWLDNIPMEASRASNAVWRAEFDDRWSTTLYFDPVTAELVSIRSDIWRLFDFVWMLHIMDYETRENFNNPVLIIFSVSALLFTISGIVLLFQSFGYARKRRKRAQS